MKWWLYNGLFAVAYAAMMPAFLLRMKRRGGYRARMGDRFGRYPAEVRARLAAASGAVWIHAVSVGEVQVAGQLLAEMRRIDPALTCVFSTTSSTGWKVAERLLGPQDVLIYNPLDFNGCVRRVFARIRPRAVILTETEIWPNFLRALRRAHVPVYLVNARISDRSAPRYRALRWFFGEAFRCFTKIYAQSDLDARRLVAAGADAQSVTVTGSVKFDVARRNPAKERELRAWIGPGDVLLGGSTWPGEDIVLLEAYRTLVQTRPDVKLVLAPRHFEKADAVEANIRAAGFACVRRSRRDPAPAADGPRPVYLCDTTGEMMGLFGIAAVAFVGKSLCAHGSQNMIEPCLCGVPTVVGPYTENFRPVMSDLLAAGALVQTPDAPDPAARAGAVKAALLKFFAEPGYAHAFAERATAAVTRRRGVTARLAGDILEAIPAASPYVPPSLRGHLVRWGVVGAYLLSACFATPALSHAWSRLELNPNRSYAGFVGLSAATALYPWCLPAARRAYAAIVEPPARPGRDEEGVMRYANIPALQNLLPQVFPGTRAVTFDARFKSYADMRAVHDELLAKDGGYRLWCLGRWDYLFLAGTNRTMRADRFAGEFSARFDAFAEAGVYSPAELLASYLGDAREIGPALVAAAPHPGWSRFVQRLLPGRLAFRPPPAGGREPIRPSRLTPREQPSFAWLARGACDGNVYLDILDRAAVAQDARRNILVGLDLAEAGGYASTNALPLWSAAAQANPRDPFLKNLADTLDLQGRRFLAIGNIPGAMACYENRILVQPRDVAAIHNFGVCLRRSGHFDVAAQVFMKAAKMTPDAEPHLLAFADCAAAAGHPEDALKTLEMLRTRTSGPVAEIERRIRKIRADLYRRNIKEYYK